uniref:Adenylate kinase active site lid domain-containing protein n=1 Tax=Chromera velia CCMP2878 TaxID=1169474 RepID=A0A0G4FBJ1_9ALVE|mmetsp:Transcript_25289/g.49429  ORF Transcript_25289/g.49429 Transcript_25289/m.49429 type:complete len:235 (+) Transcript_25289:182-886(+)|eukprot:Cvel_16171.t1-p1 / transcript=Cvel_16171.t1 / gene=Cvel_16171 / organism=Chromera_velia_CCMP2878 / gene_product=Adenylate kinase, putative / transcript_product=Adenylate kinase, putative / location=Cvel_scaffold1233:1459-3804(-) / protein_length=234 / sequence_SO=supercontig / SO=protein_coding / is_pseudo=false
MASIPRPSAALRMVFLGAPGAGKGTYASRITKLWGVPHISTGDIIRAEIKSGSDLGVQFKSYSDKGALVPDELVVAIAKKRLSQPDVKDGYILDGFPRTVPQAEALQDADASLRPTLCVNICLPEKYLIMKLAGRRVCSVCNDSFNVADIREGEYDMPPLLPSNCKQCEGTGKHLEQRADDTEEVVKNRLQTYLDETAPLIGFYSKMGLLLDFDVKKGVADLPDFMKSIAQRVG